MIFNIIFFTFSFFSFFNSYNPPEKYRKSEYYLNKVLKKSIAKLSKKHAMRLSAIGGGTDDEGIWLIDLMFDREGKPFEINEARAVIVSCIQELLSDLNSDISLRPYLKVYPLSRTNVDFAIFTHTEKGGFVFHPFLSEVASFRGEITYSTNDETNIYKYKFELGESYEKALEILNSSNQINQGKSNLN